MKLVDVLMNYFAPQPTQLAQQPEFYSCHQKPQETATNFLAELHFLFPWCNFPILDDALLDKFTLGQMDQQLKHKLASTKDITLIKMLMMVTKGAGSSERIMSREQSS